MKKIISFEKKLEFPSMIGEVTSISLDHNLKFKDNCNIIGELTVKGSYKRTEASRLEEEFNFELPTEIILTEKIDIESSKIDVDDFYYEIENDDTIICYIDILVEGIEIVDFEEQEEEKIILDNHEKEVSSIERSVEENELRECDGDNTYEKEEHEEEKIETKTTTNYEKKEVEIIKEVNTENTTIEENESTTDNMGSLFTSLKDSEESFSTYSVYIVRQEETIESIMEKYNITKEELENYNDISTIGLGSKVIIPLKNE